jgi:DegV family protein with EDD domain
MTVAIVTDSGSDLTPAQLEEYEIRQVPLTVSFGEASFLSPDDLSPEEFWVKMQAPDCPFARTAAPSVGLFKRAFEKAFEEGHDGVVYVGLSGGLSATVRNAEMAKELLSDGRIEIVDSKSASMGSGALAIRASQMAAGGSTRLEIVQGIEHLRASVVLFVGFDTLDYLRKGGRIGAAKAAIGGMLSVKPIMTMEDGVIVPLDQPRTRAKARDRIIELMSDRKASELYVLYSPPMDAVAFRDEVIAHLPEPVPEVVTEQIIGPVIGAHTGPGSYGGVLVREF